MISTKQLLAPFFGCALVLFSCNDGSYSSARELPFCYPVTYDDYDQYDYYDETAAMDILPPSLSQFVRNVKGDDLHSAAGAFTNAYGRIHLEREICHTADNRFELVLTPKNTSDRIRQSPKDYVLIFEFDYDETLFQAQGRVKPSNAILLDLYHGDKRYSVDEFSQILRGEMASPWENVIEPDPKTMPSDFYRNDEITEVVLTR